MSDAIDSVIFSSYQFRDTMESSTSHQDKCNVSMRIGAGQEQARMARVESPTLRLVSLCSTVCDCITAPGPVLERSTVIQSQSSNTISSFCHMEFWTPQARSW